ncbi:hypothetical protein [Nocardioides marmotae]|uniref:hypothetical protein n=1 Tax=Nocardioides marmotae TaxID=2663857 RepID=UPI0012B58A3F|nr:hypothetical protein [Nocardioides marmotae]MBC9735596.1 hypothetical protein [Nocardioides marmotae]MTB86692.1 hypothetical protein [Nocardioides marmotae]
MADVDAIVEDLTSSGVHLGPGTESWLSPDQLAAFQQAVREADLPVHLVLVQPPDDSGITWGDDLLVRIHDAGGPDGVYLGVNNVWTFIDKDQAAFSPTLPDGSQLNLAMQQWGAVRGNTDVVNDAETLLSSGGPDGTALELGDGILVLAEHLSAGSLPAAASAALRAASARREREDGSTSGSTGTPAYDDGSSGDAAIGFVAVVLVVVGVVLGVRRLARRTRPGSKGAQTFALPDSVLDRVRQAGDAELARRARSDVLALGERIDAADLAGSGDAAWAAALDHYEAAGRVLPNDPTAAVDPLDAVGAVVLARRGEEALAAARKGRAFEPSTPCFLNPLHGRAARDHALEHAGRRVQAPICATCRRDLQAGRRPDILDVVVRGRPEHYFETDREPWASTGFGALEPDLVRRLHRGGRQGGRR